MGLLGGLIRALLPAVPRPIVGRVAQRYVAGATLSEALASCDRLAAEGASATLDILGEFVSDAAQAERYTAEYLELIAALGRSGGDRSISVKLSMLGLTLDPALCEASLERMCAAAARSGIPVTIDMEDSSVTDATLALWRLMRESHGNVGCVLQAYMRRTLDDIRALPPGSHVRLCKGIYVEPEEIAHKGRQAIRDNYLLLLRELLAAEHYVCIATHDDYLTDAAQRLLAETGRAAGTYEFQMLLGVRPELRRRLIAAGHPLRVYVPFGADWYAYSIRRLRENPQVAIHVMRAMVGLK